MILLDTHAWIWWINESDQMSREALGAILSSESVGVSALSCWEVGLLSSRGRIRLDRDPRSWISRALARPGVSALPLSPETALEASLLEFEEFPRDPVDRMIYATARSTGRTLITRNRRIRDFDPRGTLW